uniref:Uncharacterized protein n=1 Tax=Physcomitrium patens TaxID=3218 RepID=A0A2K1KVS6_PHYPA|nr:hypothetical protein PHYPA_004844 [Physcomitrium patens]
MLQLDLLGNIKIYEAQSKLLAIRNNLYN